MISNMANKPPTPKKSTPAKTPPTKSSNKPGPLDDVARAAKGLVRVPLNREKRMLMPKKK